MKPLPLVTVMIPTYNQATFLPAAISSALAQDYPNIEIVVSNDNSTDNTANILESFRSNDKVRVFNNDKNLGRVGNYKYMLEELASGEWVVNLDGDDYFTDNSFISKSISLINSSDSNIVFVQAGHTVKGPGEKIISNDLPNIKGQYEIINGTEYFLNFHHFSHLATLYNRKAARALDFYRFDILSTDIESFLRLALHGKVILVKESIGVWMHHGLNESKKLSIPVVEKNMLRFNAPYEYAKSLNIIHDRELLRWKKSKENGYLLNYLTAYFKDPKSIPGYLTHVLKNYPGAVLFILIPLAFLRGMNKRFRSSKG